MTTNVIQTSFAAGELAPSIMAQTDLDKYKSGAALMRNFFVDYRSGTSTRPGLKFICQALISNKDVRLIPFQFSSGVSYEIEFGDMYCRFISDGGMVLETDYAITGSNNTAPLRIVAAGNNFNNGDVVFVSGIVGVPQLNNRFYKVSGTGTTLTLTDVNGNVVNSVGYGTYVSGGTIARVYTITSPYAAEDLDLLKYVQSASVMTLTHPDYVPYELSAAAPTSWTFTAITFGTTITAPTGAAAAASSAGSTNYAYGVTAVDAEGQESALSNIADLAAAVNVRATAGTITVSWNAVTGAERYNVYKAEISFTGAVPAGAQFGFVGSAEGLNFIDSNIVPDFTTSPPVPDNPFTGNNPNTACYFQQRLSFGGSDDQPTTFWMSQPGAFHNFDISYPAQEDDAITGTIVSLQVNGIKSLVPMPGGLLVLTSKGAWQVSGSGGLGSTSPITAIDATAVPQAYNGISDVMPLVPGNDILFVQAKGSAVRNLSYNINANIYTGTDISVLSNHLFFGRQITEWAYAEEPFKLVWAIRDDGIMLNLCYVIEQKIYGWSHHDTLGLFRSVSSITEDRVDGVYVVVERLLGGEWVKTIERFDDRTFIYGDYNPQDEVTLPVPYIRPNAESAWCVDCAVQSELTEPEAGLKANSNYGSVQFEADAAVFDSGDVDSIMRMDGGIALITEFVSSTILNGTWSISPSKTLPNDPDKTPVPALAGEWSLTAPFTNFYGLDHLEGQTVSILADGGVVTPQVVANGMITLASPASLVTVGLAFLPQLQTMNLDVGGADTIQGKRKRINALTVRGANCRGLLAGRTFSTLVPIKELSANTFLGVPMPLSIGDERIVMDPLWDVPGQVCIQQNDPLPATVLGVIPEIVIGDTDSYRNPGGRPPVR